MMLRKAACVAGALTLLCVGVLAQEFRAVITGRVNDPSGASVPGARLVLANLATNEQYKATTGNDGNYTVPFLIPGVYRITVEAAGFKRAVQEKLELHINDRATANFTLEVGAMEQAVTVTAEAALLEVSSATRGQVIENLRVTELPLNGRNPFMLSALVAGVQRNGNMVYGRPFDNGAIADWSINGGLTRQNEFLLDGAPNNSVTNLDGSMTRGGNNIAFVPPVDATQEFKIMSNTYDAQYGRSAGGIVNVTLKSGTNELHGTGYEFMRRYWLDANNFQNNLAGLNRYSVDPKTGENLGGHYLDQYGGQLSGPVRLPKLYNGKDRTFYLFSFEGYREGTPMPLISSVPSMLERQGDFSQAGITIWDPLTSRDNPAFDASRAESASNPRYVRDQFPGSRVPASRISPIGSRIANAYPEPNLGAAGARFNNHLLSPNIAADTMRSYIARVDHNFSPTHRMFFRYLHNRRNEKRNQNGLTGQAMYANDPLVRINDGGVVDSLITLSPTTILNLRGSYTRYIEARYRTGAMGFDMTALGFPASLAALRTEAIVPRVSPEQYQDWGPPGWDDLVNNQLSFQASVSRVSGMHSYKAGIDVRDLRLNVRNSGYGGGRFTFDREFTRRLPQYSDSASGSAIASLLMGYPGGGQIDKNAFPAFRWGYYAPYFQDDIKLTTKLTVNLGVRYDYESAPTERFNRMNRGFGFNQVNPLAAAIKNAPGLAECPACANLTGGLLFAGVGAQPRQAFDADRNNWQARAGAAYQVARRTVLRGGYGTFYTAQAELGGMTGFSVSTPFIDSVGGGAAGYIPANTLANPFPDGVIAPPGASEGLLTQRGLNLTFNRPERRIPYVHQFSFGVQHELPGNVKLDASYVGTRSRDLMTNGYNAGSSRNINSNTVEQLARARQDSRWYTQAVGNPFAGLLPGTAYNSATVARSQLLRPYPQFGNISQGLENVGRTWYNSLQFNLEKRFSQGLTVVSAYTLSKNIEELGFLNDQDLRPARAMIGFDRTHRWVVSGVYQLPFGRARRFAGGIGKGLNLLIGGWDYTWIATFQSGVPVAYSSNVDLVGNPKISNPKIDRWFDGCVLQLDGTSRQPNASRKGFEGCSNPVWAIRAPYTLRTIPFRSGQMRSHWADQYDMSLNKTFFITERYRAQFRFETFNTFNTPIFGAAATDPNSPLFGYVTPSQTNTPRNIQFGFKFLF